MWRIYRLINKGLNFFIFILSSLIFFGLLLCVLHYFAAQNGSPDLVPLAVIQFWEWAKK